eukprot:TRINITY_DN6847_c0_g1_i1.p1 TRINITY_DN6847_c0_g1~~TRINITY_DN6847_c0_g1_i1.p1  ORF type:complete len:799 (+),score=342.81 TRINITY_DN6847_c0_g1_i1:153-2399(+)
MEEQAGNGHAVDLEGAKEGEGGDDGANNATRASVADLSNIADDEVLHMKIEEVQHKELRKERRALKDLHGMVLDTIPMIADVTALTHKGIVEQLLGAMYPKEGDEEKERILHEILPPKREDGTEVWREGIEGRGFAVVMGKVAGLEENRIGLARLHTPLSLTAGGSQRQVRFVGLCVGPPHLDAHMTTRTVLETARSLASVLSEPEFRLKAEGIHSDADLQKHFSEFVTTKKGEHEEFVAQPLDREHDTPLCVTPFSGLIADVKRRAKWYASDFTEAWEYKGKVLSTAIYLFCVILAPAIAFGELMSEKTKQNIGPMEILISQSASGLIFSLLGGCPFVIIMTTGPLTVFIGFLYDLTDAMGIEFLPFYAWVGVWNSFWLFCSVAFNLSNQIHYVTAFVDQIFACLVAGIFAYEAIKPTSEDFFTPADGHEAAGCMGVVLSLGTFIASVKLMDMRTSNLTSKTFREILSDYGTAIAVLLMAGIYHLAKVDHVETLEVPDYPELTKDRDLLVDMANIPLYAVFVAAGPAFLLFTLFFLDENITSILSNRPEFKLRKGEAMHQDLFVVAIINLFLGMLGLPFLHGALPQSPLHVLQLADMEEYVEQGVLRQRVVKSRETRLTSLLCHVLMTAATIGALPALKALPVPVLHGVFLTMAYQGAKDNPFVERLLLWFTELASYPPTHMVRRLRLKTIYLWTAIQLVCFAFLWGVKMSPAALGFPFVIVILVVIRHKMLPCLFTPHDISLLEGE